MKRKGKIADDGDGDGQRWVMMKTKMMKKKKITKMKMNEVSSSS